MARRGRRTKYTPDVVDRIEQALQLGASYRLACLYGGISEDTFGRWRDKKPEFAEIVARAEGIGAVQLLEAIDAAASAGNWRAAAWILERRYPEEYGRRVHELRGSEGAPVVFTLRLGET